MVPASLKLSCNCDDRYCRIESWCRRVTREDYAGEAPGLKMQSELFRDNWGHPTQRNQALAAYCHFVQTKNIAPERVHAMRKGWTTFGRRPAFSILYKLDSRNTGQLHGDCRAQAQLRFDSDVSAVKSD